MPCQSIQPSKDCPVSTESISADIDQYVEELQQFCLESDLPFREFEKRIKELSSKFCCQLTQLFLLARHQRCDVQPYLEDGQYRPGNKHSKRTLKTQYGEVSYWRTYLINCDGGNGFFPLDAELGLSSDSFTPSVIGHVGRLATQMSFKGAQQTCELALGWSPCTESIEQMVLGLGREAETFMEQLPLPEGDGEVLIIEIDGKCAPMATQEELCKRRRPRRSRQGCTCGCQRHRGKGKRRERGSKKRRKKGDKSKNGKEAVLVVMYTLRSGSDGKLHGPINKRVWATFAGRRAAAEWARAEATRRGFGPDTDKTVQIVIDGAKGLQQNLAPLFPNAIFTLDICHVEEKLWDLGHRYHKEGSDELIEWVGELRAMLYNGQAEQLVEKLRGYLQEAPKNGPGSKGRRQQLTTLINYLEPRLSMMQYQKWIEQDLVISSGQVEGGVRHIVGQRMDCSGMRWTLGKGQALLQLRCIVINGDWEPFIEWYMQKVHQRLLQREKVSILTDQPIKMPSQRQKGL